MGCWKDNSPYNSAWLCLNGLLTDVRIWKGARTLEDLNAYSGARLVGNEENLVAYWPLNETEGSVAYDLGAGHMDGTFINNVVWDCALDLPLSSDPIDCPPNRFKDGTECVEICPEGKFGDLSGPVRVCVEACPTCAVIDNELRQCRNIGKYDYTNTL